MSFFSNLTNQIRTLDSNILLVDGMNTFIRGTSISHIVNDNGVPIGGYGGFLLSLGYAIKLLKPTHCIVVFDGVNGSSQRKAIFPDYKANRNVVKTAPKNSIYNSVEEENFAIKLQLNRLLDYLKLFPIHIVMIDNAEADDVIAHIVHTHKNSKKYIMSTDQDFYQLIDEDTFVYSPTKKIIIDENYIKENFDLIPKNFIIHKIFNGDNSDNIPGVSGVGLKTLQKRIPFLFEDKRRTVDDIYNYLDTCADLDKYKILSDMKNSKERMQLNYKIMQLEEPLLFESQKEEIKKILESEVPKLNTFSFLKYSTVDGLEGTIIKYTQKWVTEVFSNLTNYIKV